MKILAIGDVHLGRSPTGLPTEVDPSAFGPREALRRCVKEAIEGEADAVLLLGDVVDDARNVLEGYAALRREIGWLTKEGIRVFGVAGNHDVLVLPKLAQEIEGFRLLGAGGVWESVVVTGRAGGRLTLVGWSFLHEVACESPLWSFPADLERTGPVLGLLHCDLDAANSRYAPVRRSELEATPVDAWLLGHVHKPHPIDAMGGRPIGYLGAITALDPSDLGPRGPWWVEIEQDGSIRARHVPLAPLRFEEIEVDVTDLAYAGVQDLLGRIQDEARRRAHALEEEGRERVLVGMRVRLTGSHPAAARMRRDLEELPDEPTEPIPEQTVKWFLDQGRIVCSVRRWQDLDEVAELGGPVAALSRDLRVLDGTAGTDEERNDLLREARAALGRTGLPLGNLDPLLADVLRDAAEWLLVEMLEQQEEDQ